MNGRQQTDGNLALEQNNVIVIEAAQRPEAQKLRVAAYCRVSSDSSDQMNSFAAQKESESISGNMRWSYQHRMKNGNFITCKAPFGYRLKDGMLEIYEPEAEIVRTIFSQYLAGQSKDEIAAMVTALGIPTRDGKGYWQHSSISYILRNERYVGDALLQKRYTTDTLPYQKKINHGEREQYYLPQSHPPIIDRETFNAVKELLDRRSIIMPKRERDPLSLKITCGTCGTPFRRTVCNQKNYWVCRKHYKSKHNCPMEQIAEDEIHAAFLRVYHKLRLHGEPILKQMLDHLQTVRERRMLWSLEVIELNKRISDINDQDRMLADMNRCGLVDPDIFISRSNELAQQLRAAKQEKDRVLGAEHDDTTPQTRELREGCHGGAHKANGNSGAVYIGGSGGPTSGSPFPGRAGAAK